MANAYEQMAATLEAAGIQFHLQSPTQLVVSGQVGPVWPDRGNSFWMTYATGRWHLFTWSPVGYRIPEAADIVDLCRACMVHGSSAMYSVPQDIATKFGLAELSESEADAVFTEMDTPT